MPIEILMPALSPTMTEGNLAKWVKNEGDKIAPGELIAEIETDKATMEVESVDSGVLAKILVKAGSQNVKVNQLIAVVLEDGETEADLSKFLENYESIAGDQNPHIADKKEQSDSAILIDQTDEKLSDDSRVKASPLARKVAKLENIDLHTVKGTGPAGRIIRDDVLKAKDMPKNISSAKSQQAVSGEKYDKIPNSNIRKTIARRLSESKQNIPHFYLAVECNMDKLLAARVALNEDAVKNNQDYKLSVNDFVIKASALALKAVPEANSSWTDEAILQYRSVDISIAVATDGGLITPIIFDADLKSLKVISSEMKHLAKKARENKLQPHEFQGGGFSISNLGMYGIDSFQAIVNPPQSCIIAVGATVLKPIIAENGEMKAANMMNITLSCDHRAVDGAVGARFLSALKKYIENPLLMLV